MILLEYQKLSNFDKLTYLHTATNGYDKFIMAELLNNFFDQFYKLIVKKHKDITPENLDTDTFFINGFYFDFFEIECYEFKITKKLLLFDFGDVSFQKPSKEINYFQKIDSEINKIETIFYDKCLNETEQKKLTSFDFLRSSFEEQPQHIKPVKSNISELIQGTNENGTNFFEYLIENYRQNETSKVKFVNILHFLKNDANKKYFTFKVRQKDYNNIVSKYDMQILKFSKSQLYLEDEKPILHSLETAFLKTLTP